MKALAPACFVLLLLLTASPCWAQKRLEIDAIEICSYYGEQILDDLYSFDSDKEAQSFVGDIMQFTGLPQNFTIEASNVPNAAAVIRKTGGSQQRLILYSQEFIRQVVAKTGSEWAATSIMAHEVGHHLSGHTLPSEDGRRPDTELEADKFSGHILFKMGASLEEAKVALSHIKDEKGSKTHPPKSARLAAVHNGWLLAQDQAPKPKPSPPPPSETRSPDLVPKPPVARQSQPKPRQRAAEIGIVRVDYDVPATHPALFKTDPGLAVRIAGAVSNAQGSNLQVVVRFSFYDGRPLWINPRETHFHADGQVATGTEYQPVRSQEVDLSTIPIRPMPYYALNLEPTNYTMTYQLTAIAAVYLDDGLVAQSPPYQFEVRW